MYRRSNLRGRGKALDAGEILKPGSCNLWSGRRKRPLTGGFSRVEDVAGRVVLYPLPKGEPFWNGNWRHRDPVQD